MLVTSEALLLDAQKNKYAVGAFNIENMEMVQAVVSAVTSLGAPAILQTTPSTVRYGGVKMIQAMVAAAAADSKSPIALHLDHGDSFSMAMQALRAGYTSIMIDGSQLSFEENIALSKRVVDAAQPNDIPVEAELGKVGGKEDDSESENAYTDPAEAAEFVARTGISSLAVAIGTAHGVYAGEPKLDLARLSELRAAVSIPLVLHGASGLSEDVLVECIHRGISKINFATELRVAYSNGVKACVEKDPKVFDPKKYGAAGRDFVREAVLRLCGICMRG